MKSRERLEQLGIKILNLSRTDILLNLPYLNTALLELDFVMDLSTPSIGTDAFSIRFNPNFLIEQYRNDPVNINRIYMHMLLHCLFGHVFSSMRFDDKELFNISCDIAAEYVLDTIDAPCLHRPLTDVREEIYALFENKINVLTAERIYEYLESLRNNETDSNVNDSESQDLTTVHDGNPSDSFSTNSYDKEQVPASQIFTDSYDKEQVIADQVLSNTYDREQVITNQILSNTYGREQVITDKILSNPYDREQFLAGQIFTNSYDREQYISRIFFADDHSFWARERESSHNDKQPEVKSPLPLPLMNASLRLAKKEEWDKVSKRVQSELNLLTGTDSGKSGKLTWLLSLQNDRYEDFGKYLMKYAVTREEVGIDPDSFNLGLYNYGLEYYGNMPLIEENELRISKKISSLVIAIDTSASCKDVLVKKFLSQTAAILLKQEMFFSRFNLFIIECDNCVQNVTRVTDINDLKNYAGHFTAHGGYGTDFTPVFTHVKELTEKGELQNLKGLLYFTDGFGTFPKTATHYETAFVFYRDSPYNEKDVPPWAVKLFFTENENDNL